MGGANIPFVFQLPFPSFRVFFFLCSFRFVPLHACTLFFSPNLFHGGCLLLFQLVLRPFLLLLVFLFLLLLLRALCLLPPLGFDFLWMARIPHHLLLAPCLPFYPSTVAFSLLQFTVACVLRRCCCFFLLLPLSDCFPLLSPVCSSSPHLHSP